MKKKKILILGANGLIGNFIFKNLSKTNKVFGLSHSQKNNKRIFKTDYKNFTKKIISLINQSDFIINCIGENSNEKKMEEININVLNNISLQIKKKKICFIHLSTCGVYETINPNKKINENSKKNYNSLYSKTKMLGEKILIKNLKDVSKLIILRPSQIIGENMKNTSVKKLYYYIKKKMFFFINNKYCFFSYIFAEDLLNIIILLINKKPKNNIYNISNKINYYNLVKIIQKDLNQSFSFPSVNYNFIKMLLFIFNKVLRIKLPINNRILKSMTTYNIFNSQKIISDLKIKSFSEINVKSIKYLVNE